jgi:hypothetical protein
LTSPLDASLLKAARLRDSGELLSGARSLDIAFLRSVVKVEAVASAYRNVGGFAVNTRPVSVGLSTPLTAPFQHLVAAKRLRL